MKKIRAIYGFTALLFFLGGCNNFFQPPQGPGRTVPAGISGMGQVSLRLVSVGPGRTLLPTTVQGDFAKYELAFTSEGKEPVDVIRTNENLSDQVTLPVGVWNLEVRAYLEGDPGEYHEAATGSVNDIEIFPETGTDASVTLNAIIGGEGTFTWNASYPADTAGVTLTITPLNPETGTTEEIITLKSGGTGISNTGSRILKGGYYRVRISVRNRLHTAGRRDILHVYQNMTTRADFLFTAADLAVIPVTSANDSGPGTLREAIVMAEEGNTISVDLPAGTAIELLSPLTINKKINIAGNGVTLTPAAAWTASTASSMLYINSTTAEVTISGVHFKNGRAADYGAAVRNTGILELESCIFSGNLSTASSAQGGAVFSGNTLSVSGCTFYGNTSGGAGGAVYFSASGKPLTLTGNLFYGNTAGSYYPVVYIGGGTARTSYNAADIDFGTGSTQCGWIAGTGDKPVTPLPLSPKTFKILSGSGAAGVISLPPSDYPVVDFYGASIGANAAAGAVQAVAVGNGYYLDLTINNSLAGTVTVSPPPDEDGLVSGPFTITANPAGGGYAFGYWLVNGVRETDNSLSLAGNTWVQAIFSRTVIVNTFTDSNTPGTLRHALANAHDGDTISFSGVTAGITTIELQSVLPNITKSIIIEGNGVTLTPAAAWTASQSSQLLYISSNTAEVTIRRVHFKNGRTLNYGGAVYNTGTLTLESCIFSGNSAASSVAYGGAVYSNNTLNIRGCTFYGNTSGGTGGAVYFRGSEKILTLTGNLFYGNTAVAGYPVVEVSSGTVSASYNAADIAFGTTGSQCGWAAGNGNKPATALPVSPKTFRLLSGSGAIGAIPVLPANYPAADFYGTSIGANAAAGAVQAVADGYYLDLSVNSTLGGTVQVSPVSVDDNGCVPASVSIMANLNDPDDEEYVFGYWLVNGVQMTDNPLSLTGHSFVRAVFQLPVTVNDFTDEEGDEDIKRTFRYALANAQDGDIISFSEATPGTKTIELQSALPNITKNIIIEGNGVTLTPAASWTASQSSQLLYISSSTAEVTIRGVHFKDGRAADYGAAIRNEGILTLESCIFSGNQTTTTHAEGGAVYSGNTLNIKGCTFYGNISGYAGGAVYFKALGKTLTLTGNLFYRNTASSYPAVYVYGTSSASYNVADIDFGTGSTQCGWTAGIEDKLVTAFPISAKTFRLLSGSGAVGVITALPANYPAADFYGDPIEANAAAGAVQAVTAGDGYYLDLTVDNSLAGTVELVSWPLPDEDGLVSDSFHITADPNSGYIFGYWLVNGIRAAAPPTELSSHTWVQAVFYRLFEVDDFTDEEENEPAEGTLRYALANAQDGDTISFSVATPGTKTIELQSALPNITKSITIEGNGVTLTPAASWTASQSSQLLYISSSTAEVTISRVHFKNGLAADYGGAIRNDGILTLKSCIFSGNSTTSADAYGGAVYSGNTLNIKSCTFYGNTSGGGGGAVCFSAPGKTLTMMGNLFYGNTAVSGYPVARVFSGTVGASYNVADIPLGTGTALSGWTAGTGDKQVTNLPVSPRSFRLLSGSGAAQVIPTPLPPDYPVSDFYGIPQIWGGTIAAGAVRAAVTGNGYYLDLSKNNTLAGTVTILPPLSNEDGLVSGSFTITQSSNEGYTFDYWLVNGVQVATAPTSLAGHTFVRAVFKRSIAVNIFNDGTNSENIPGTLRYALVNAQDGDIISFNGVTAGTTTIELQSALPRISKSISIEGKGVILVPAVSWTASYTSQLLYISSSIAEVKVSGVHFKDGRALNYGGAIRNDGILTLESCIFSGNMTASTYGGAVYSSNTLNIRGCTFYGNSASYGGAVYFLSSEKSLTLMGNLFYGNTAVSGYPIVGVRDGNVSASYNVTDIAFGTGTAQCGWVVGTGDKTILPDGDDLSITGIPFNTTTFEPASGLRNVLPYPRPEKFPETDFKGIGRTFPGAPGAIK
jgi:hypothetical protein